MILNYKYIHHVDTCGFAQLGRPDFERKENFEIMELMKAITQMRPPKNTKFHIAKNHHDFGTYKSIVIIGDNCPSKTSFKNYCDRVDDMDYEKIEEDLLEGYMALKGILKHQEFDLIEGLEVDHQTLAIVNGYSDPYALLDAVAFRSVVPTTCPLGCQVEPDGTCNHGFPSFLLSMSVI